MPEQVCLSNLYNNACKGQGCGIADKVPAEKITDCVNDMAA